MDNIRNKTADVIESNVNVRRISWGAIIAGALVMMVIMLLFSLLGLGVGLGAIDANSNSPMQGLGTGTLVWWVISNLIAVFAGGYVAAKLTNVAFKGSGLMHGIVAWSLYTVISFFVLTTTVGAVFSGTGKLISKSMAGLGQGAGSLISAGQDLPQVQQTINKYLGNDADASTKVMNILKQTFIQDGKLNTNVQQSEIESAVAQNTNLDREQVRKFSNEINEVYQKGLGQLDELKQGATEAKNTASKAAIWSFIALLLGAAAAGAGGKFGEIKDEDLYIKEKYNDNDKDRATREKEAKEKLKEEYAF